MAAGYAFGAIMFASLPSVAGCCLRIGSVRDGAVPRARAVLGVFGAGAPGDATAGALPAPEPEQVPGVAALPADDARADDRAAAARRTRARVVRRLLATFGRVPMFYYLLHIPLIHAAALLVWLVRDGVSMRSASRLPRSCRFPRRAMGASAPLPGVRDRRRSVVHSVPMVCGREGSRSARLASLFLAYKRDSVVAAKALVSI